jgi:hypothetical protein
MPQMNILNAIEREGSRLAASFQQFPTQAVF